MKSISGQTYKLSGREADIKKMWYEEKLPVNQIAQKLGVSWTCVAKFLPKLGITFEFRYPSGEDDPHWRGGHKYKASGQQDSRGYILIHPPDYHKLPHDKRYVRRNRFIWEQTHGVPVPKGYEVHHLNGIKDDDRPENLVALPKGTHTTLHHPSYKVLQERIRDLEYKLAQLSGEGVL